MCSDFVWVLLVVKYAKYDLQQKSPARFKPWTKGCAINPIWIFFFTVLCFPVLRQTVVGLVEQKSLHNMVHLLAKHNSILSITAEEEPNDSNRQLSNSNSLGQWSVEDSGLGQDLKCFELNLILMWFFFYKHSVTIIFGNAYLQKRDFTSLESPTGSNTASDKNRFLVQNLVKLTQMV